MNISIIGAGNMANQLGLALLQSGHKIDKIYNRTYLSAKTLAEVLNGQAVSDIKGLSPKIDILIIAVSDEAISEIVAQLSKKKWEDVIVMHTSGSISSAVLEGFSLNAVFYPFQSMTAGQELEFRSVPLLLTSKNETVLTKLKQVAVTLSDLVYEISDDQRKVVHIAGVLANNFSNHLFVLANDLLEQHELSFDILKPLIRHTVEKLDTMDPLASQTGPGVRGDAKVIIDHLKQLDQVPELYEIYAIMTKSIMDRHFSTPLKVQKEK
ncbi:MAG: DUF2520 domain-containing protein [Bacteroidia bacterium]|nr:DUF2520 domain-containing protein [Bacteroidia bacterium]